MNKLQNLVSSIQGSMLALLAIFFMTACSTLPDAQVSEKRLESTASIPATLDPIKMDPFVVNVALVEPIAPLPHVKYVDKVSLDCLAKTIWFEAKGEPERGQIAVGHVVLNRTKDPRFPNTVCGVVTQSVKGKKSWSCQFHWYCDGKSDAVKDQKAFAKIVELARRVLSEETVNPIGNSLFFHATYVAQQKKRYSTRFKVGNHIFYA